MNEKFESYFLYFWENKKISVYQFYLNLQKITNLFHQIQTTRSVTTPKMIPVIQMMEEFIDNNSLLESFSLRNHTVITIIKSFRKSTKHFGDSQIKFRMTIKTRRIKDQRFLGFCSSHITRPQIAMDQSRNRVDSIKDCLNFGFTFAP